jgi:predicted RNA-binding Zn-ribbon protein involved in translation (DUF1610 family)
MDKLQELIEKFRNDTSWNTENKNGTHRFDEEILWIESMIRDYAKTLKLSTDKVVEIMESKRDYSWPNYYQPANFPELNSENLVGVFDTFEAFREHSQKHYQGFKCPSCGNIGSHPQECEHRVKKDKICDWCSYGFFSSVHTVIILEDGLKAIPIFEPVLQEASNEKTL